ncbi:MAG: hypothetical protein HN576_02410 [Bacteriovoracaceae bacterium]|jgi:hypothetical protein|nr:hypothetical protein [Bacteriovoracaceae bacterium]
MKKLLLAAILFLSVNSTFALSENASSDCQSLSSNTADAEVVSASDSSQTDDGSSAGSAQ